MPTKALDNLWTEKYRPTDLDRLALKKTDRRFLEECIETGEIPHLLLVGPAGTGKTTTAEILIEELDAASIELNASNDRGIDVVRDEVATFARGRMGREWNIVFLDEAGALTPDAQHALRRIIEEDADVTRFILTTNYEDKLIDPIKSRCTVLRLEGVDLRERVRVLKRILDEEGAAASTEQIVNFARPYQDLRRLIRDAQKSVLTHGELRAPDGGAVSGEEIYELVKAEEWDRLVKISSQEGFDHRKALEDLYWAIEDDFDHAANWRMEVFKSLSTRDAADPAVQFTGTCATLMAVASE